MVAGTLPLRLLASTTVFAVFLTLALRAWADDASTLESGINSYEGSRYPECVQRFRAMLTAGSSTTLTDPRFKNRARIYYSTCLIATKRAVEADDQMKQLVREDTRYIPDRAAFPGAILDRFTEIRVVMKEEIDRLERKRLQQEQDDEQRREDGKKRAAAHLRRLEAYARTETLVQRNTRWLALLPFGVGQFQNGQTAFAWTLLGTQSVFGAASIVTALAKNSLESNFEFGRSDSAQAEERRSLIVTLNRVSFGVFAAAALGGILHAQLTFVDEVRKTRERKLPPNFLWTPVVAPRLGGGTVGVQGIF